MSSDFPPNYDLWTVEQALVDLGVTIKDMIENLERWRDGYVTEFDWRWLDQLKAARRNSRAAWMMGFWGEEEYEAWTTRGGWVGG